MFCLILPQGGVVQGVCTCLEPPSMVSFEVLAPRCTDGHLVDVTELKQELDRWGAAARHRRVVSNAPVLPLGVWADNTLLMRLMSQLYSASYVHMEHLSNVNYRLSPLGGAAVGPRHVWVIDGSFITWGYCKKTREVRKKICYNTTPPAERNFRKVRKEVFGNFSKLKSD